jgi:hypothetical protein
MPFRVAVIKCCSLRSAQGELASFLLPKNNVNEKSKIYGDFAMERQIYPADILPII